MRIGLLQKIVKGTSGKLVLFDLNETFIENGTGRITVPLEQLKKALQSGEERGVIVGLCSDSPHEPMVRWAHAHGISGPVLAEAGLVVDGEALISVRLQPVSAAVLRWCQRNRVRVSKEHALAPEFGGQAPADRPCVAFGYGRQCTLSVYTYAQGGGPDPAVTARLGAFLIQRFGNSVDLWTDGGIIIVHGSPDFRDTKPRALQALGSIMSRAKKRLFMVGNSRSDLVGAPDVCRVYMVGNCTEEARAGADVVVDGHYTEGVIQALEHIANE